MQAIYLFGTWDTEDARASSDVDLINIRAVSTVMQKEIIMADRRIYCGDQYAADEFEMLTTSYYQKPNAERAEILENVRATGRIYQP
ncbi:MAG: hypothetical protein R8J84_04055 [Mariprofundales bacterium]